MSRGVKVRVWGDYALFSRPEMKVERCSYDVMTPSAARGILEAIYWHPGMRWMIDKIYVKKPIRFTSVRRNEVKNKILSSNVLQAYNGGDKSLYLLVCITISSYLFFISLFCILLETIFFYKFKIRWKFIYENKFYNITWILGQIFYLIFLLTIIIPLFIFHQEVY